MIATTICGLVFKINYNGEGVNEDIKTIFTNQIHRGRSGFGFTAIYDDRIDLKRFVLEKDFLDALNECKSSCIMMHQRIPTSSSNNVIGNHPIYLNNDVYNYNYYLIHNGHISNCDDLKIEHEKLGLIYSSNDGYDYTDSESLAHELALVIEEKKEPKDFNAKGGMAFIMIQTDKFNNPLAMWYGRNCWNPLKIQKTDSSLTLRSESPNGETVEANILFRYDYNTKEITKKEISFGDGMSMLPSPTIVESNAQINVIMNLYEHQYIPYMEIDTLRMEELGILMFIARKVLSNDLMEIEKKLLTATSDELSFARSRYDTTLKIISNLELKMR